MYTTDNFKVFQFIFNKLTRLLVPNATFRVFYTVLHTHGFLQFKTNLKQANCCYFLTGNKVFLECMYTVDNLEIFQFIFDKLTHLLSQFRVFYTVLHTHGLLQFETNLKQTNCCFRRLCPTRPDHPFVKRARLRIPVFQ